MVEKLVSGLPYPEALQNTKTVDGSVYARPSQFNLDRLLFHSCGNSPFSPLPADTLLLSCFSTPAALYFASL
jgi:hypothetical protein